VHTQNRLVEVLAAIVIVALPIIDDYLHLSLRQAIALAVFAVAFLALLRALTKVLAKRGREQKLR